jgi:long-chain acyl-CoA synthetase
VNTADRWSAAQVEAHYGALPFVAEICALPTGPPGDGAARGWRALIVPNRSALRTRRVVNVRELLRFEFETLGVVAPPDAVLAGFDVTFAPLPRTPAGTVDREAVAARVASRPVGRAGRDEPATGPATSTPWCDTLVSWFSARYPDTTVTGESSLEFDLGLDSIGRVEALAELERALGSRLDEAAAADAMTVGELAAAVRSTEPSGSGTASRLPPHHGTGAEGPGEDTWTRLLATAPPGDEFTAELARDKPVRALAGFLTLRAAGLLARLLIGLRASGLSHVPASGPYLLCSNHVTFLDGFLLCMVLPLRTIRAMFFLGASEYFATATSARLAKSINLVPVDPDAGLLRALRVAALGLRQGRVLILFPEGERTIDGELKLFRRGGAILASRLGVPIVPVAIEGAFELWPRGRPVQWRRLWPPFRHRTRILLGPAFTPGHDGEPTGEVAVADHLARRVADLQAQLRLQTVRGGAGSNA